MHARFVTHSFARHFHEGYCLGVIEDGALGFRYRGENLVAPAGSVNLAVPGEVHDGHGAVDSGWAYRMFYLEPEFLQSVAAQLSPKPGSLPHFRPGVIDDPQLAESIISLHRDMEQGQLSQLEEQTRLLHLLTGWIGRYADDSLTGRAVGTEHGAVRRAREIIEARFGEEVTLSDLARETNLSPYHLVRTFTKHIGMPPHAYQTQVRVNRAAALLSGPLPIVDIAANTGFADQSHLTRWFKRQRGVTPGQYRKIVQDR